jgi:PASTA domain
MRTVKYAVALSVAVIGLGSAAAALAGTAQPGAYSGTTSQPGSNVSFTVANGGGSVEGFKADMSAICTKGSVSQSVDVTLTPTPSMKIRQSEFGFSGGFVFHNGPEVIGHGKGKVSGSFAPDSSVTGSLRFPWDFFANAGLLGGYHCDTGKVTFHGSRASDASAVSRCVVPTVKGKKLKVAKRAIKRAHCHVGRVVKRHSSARRRRVIAQRPRPGTKRAAGSAVKVVVSRGPAR